MIGYSSSVSTISFSTSSAPRWNRAFRGSRGWIVGQPVNDFGGMGITASPIDSAA